MSDEELSRILKKKFNGIVSQSQYQEVEKQKLHHLNDGNFDSFLQEKKNVIVDFFADWCGPCKIMTPTFEALAKEVTSITFAKINVDENPATSEKYYIMSVPTILYFKDGRLVDKTVGVIPKDIFRKKIKDVYRI
ncbi:MAG: thioredoxin [Nitrososphaeria archaeon]